MVIKNIFLQNFCKHERLAVNFGKKTVISGKNGYGKSTIKTAIQYVLGFRNENGKEIGGIRPHDESGVDIDGLTTTVSMTIESDGAENELKREVFQAKNRQGEYTGTDNISYFVDNVKKNTKKSYDEFVQEFVPNEICMNANTLLMKDTAGRREMLKAFERHTDDDVLNENPQFECLRGKLRANKVSDIRKALNEQIKGSKSVIGYEQMVDKIDVQIKMLEEQKRDIDLAELELHRNVIKEQMEAVKLKIADTDNQLSKYTALCGGVLQLKFKLSELDRQANEGNNKKRLEIDNQITDKNYEKRAIERNIDSVTTLIEHTSATIREREAELRKLFEEYNAENERLFDENSLVCPYCKQEYPESEKDRLRADFESHKATLVKSIVDKGKVIRARVTEDKDSLRKFENELAKSKSELETVTNDIFNLKTKLLALPNTIDVSGTDEYKMIMSQISEQEEALAKMNEVSRDRERLNAELEDLHTESMEVEQKISLAQKNVELDEKISQLQAERREISLVKIPECEKELYLLKEFERKKAELLENDVNEYFEFAHVKMFEMQVNGEFRDVCEFYRNGTAYGRNLNCSDKILTEVDICRAFQKLYGVEAPIIIDNSESIDSDRIPDVPNQLILIKRTDDEELKIEVVE